MLKTPISGKIVLKKVNFSYPRRSPLFKDLSLKIRRGEWIGMVGHSGSGKSTIIQLLMRFYEPTSGQILLDGVELKDYDIHYLRSSLGLVNQ